MFIWSSVDQAEGHSGLYGNKTSFRRLQCKRFVRRGNIPSHLQLWRKEHKLGSITGVRNGENWVRISVQVHSSPSTSDMTIFICFLQPVDVTKIKLVLSNLQNPVGFLFHRIEGNTTRRLCLGQLTGWAKDRLTRSKGSHQNAVTTDSSNICSDN